MRPGARCPGPTSPSSRPAPGAVTLCHYGAQGRISFYQPAHRPVHTCPPRCQGSAVLNRPASLTIGDTRTVNVALKVGAVTETVRVSGREPGRDSKSCRWHPGRAGPDRRAAAQRPGRQTARSCWPEAPWRRISLRGDRGRVPAAIPIAVAGGTSNSHDVPRGRRLQQRPAEQHRQPDPVPGRAAGVSGRERACVMRDRVCRPARR